MNKLKFNLLIAGAVLLVAADGNQPITIDEIANQNNQFAFGLYNEIANQEDGNIFFSPFSVSTALAMTYAGANGTTASEIEHTMRFGKNKPEFHYAYGNYLRLLDKNAADNIQLRVANRLWGEKTYKLKPSFVKLNKRAYDSPLKPMDFVNQPNESREEINAWVEEKTENRIQKLLPPGSINNDTRLVITNAIYFKGDWLYQFKKKKTKQKRFYLNADNGIKVPFMHLEGAFQMQHTTSYKMIKLPYKGEKQSMVVVLPNEGVAISDVEKEINGSAFTQLNSGYMPEVELALPKFKLTQPLSLAPMLQNMGMKLAFTDNADFSNMTDENNLAISSVVHKAFVQVDEAGTEAAAATAVVMVLTSTNTPDPKPVQFNCNRPFLFYVIDDETQSMLFMGRIMEPEWEE